jgi:hypothetical protein
MQDFAWDPLKDEIFMTQNIRTANGRATIRINSRVVDVENNTVRLARRAHSPHQGDGYGDGLEESLRDAGLRKPSVIDFGVTPATLIGLILPPPSCTRDACREDWIFRGDSWHD